MEKQTYYNVQFRREGEKWQTCRDNASWIKDFDSFDDAKDLYDRTVRFHENRFKNEYIEHRIVKLTVETEVIL
jgi:hypothetical protein